VAWGEAAPAGSKQAAGEVFFGEQDGRTLSATLRLVGRERVGGVRKVGGGRAA
jgi:hypothetical protein